MNRLREIPAWVGPVVTIAVIAALFLFVSPLAGVAVGSVTLAVAVVRFAGWGRLLQIAIVIFLVMFFVSMLIRFLPGDPADDLIPFSSEAQKAQLNEDLGLNDPVWQQFGGFIGDFFTGDTNYYQSTGRAVNGQPVWERLSDALPVTLQLIVYAQILALLFAIPLGILTAYRAGTKTDKAVNVMAFAFISLPNFVLAYLLVYLLAVENDFFPVSGYVPFGESPSEHFRSLFLPVVCLAVGQIAIYMRLLRSDMIQTLQEDFITMARSKGLSTRRILLRHALRPSSFTLLTVAAINIGALIGGAVVLEVIFQLPGVGTLIFDAIRARQYVALQTLVGLIAIAYVVINVIVDLLYTALDPRIRSARARA
jgi:peptide/nickel transport system permease protein